ncbi:hypothetical protein, partial [Streptomyces sp. BpilaLS-43]|uniref:hypothetical protein n=1 Tax=Streptomyces sp. BpilaLS-43 TaxID=1839778 RepID=UPI001C403DAA
ERPSVSTTPAWQQSRAGPAVLPATRAGQSPSGQAPDQGFHQSLRAPVREHAGAGGTGGDRFEAQTAPECGPKEVDLVGAAEHLGPRQKARCKT